MAVLFDEAHQGVRETYFRGPIVVYSMSPRFVNS